MKTFGIDVSKWQGNFNFNSAASEGVSFAIIKGGGNDDGLYKDPMFERHYLAAKQENIPVGCYWFSKATSLDEAEKEAEYFYSVILDGKQFELPVYIDVEHDEMLSLSKRTLTDIVNKWRSYLEDRGYYVGIYSTTYVFSRYMYDNELKRYTHWVAEWASECSYPDKSVLGLWQFGGETNLIRTNRVAGVVCDQNYMYVDFPSTVKSLGLNGFSVEVFVPEPTPTQPKKTVGQLANEVIAGKWGVGQSRKVLLTDAGYDYDAVQSKVDIILGGNDTETIPAPPAKPTFSVGDAVRLDANAVVYGKTTRFAPFVYDSLLYVRDIQGDRIAISTQKTGAVTGAVNVTYLSKV
ncbi:MAG: 1,4-beta-N-acetylmuramidase [Clostridia bacterium]|nr:1,4-beta-N-acetylmuramidase [Clostridia bacterium]